MLVNEIIPLTMIFCYRFITSSSLSILRWICHNVFEIVRKTIQWRPYGGLCERRAGSRVDTLFTKTIFVP
jgi:hypothetical protein